MEERKGLEASNLKNAKILALGIVGLIAVIAITKIIIAQGEFTYVISNSENWEDVYSAMLYASLEKAGSDFLVSTKHGSILLNSINKKNDIRVISSKKSPFVINYADLIKDKGFKDADELILDNPNLELIEELPEINNFIVVGNSYGYSAIAVAPYAVITNSWVFLADRANIDEIDSILSERDVNNLLIYGFVDREVRETLSKYNPEIINTGDRFKDNIGIVKKFLEIKPTQQVLLTNGEFIEKEIMSGTSPILFTGKENVPEQIKEYIQSSDIEVGVLIGADLVGAATNIRRSTGISVIVKFARGARVPAGTIAAVEGLDLFYLPVPIMDLELDSAKYNRATSQLEVTYKSNSNIPIYFKGTLTPVTASGKQTKIGDVEPVFIAPNDFKTVSYSDVDFTDEKISLEVFTLYGETPSSLEKILEKKIDVDVVNVIDRCEIDIESVKYTKSRKEFSVKVLNPGSIDCWVDVELSDVIIDGVEKTIGSEGSVKILAGKKGKIVIRQEMTEEDLKENHFVNVIAYYGERENGLVKILKGKYELKVESISFATLSLIILALIVLVAVIVLIFLFIKKKREDEW